MGMCILQALSERFPDSVLEWCEFDPDGDFDTQVEALQKAVVQALGRNRKGDSWARQGGAQDFRAELVEQVSPPPEAKPTTRASSPRQGRRARKAKTMQTRIAALEAQLAKLEPSCKPDTPF